jgi:hypothetical protein
LGLNWSSLLGSASTELVASFGCCPWAFVVITDGLSLDWTLVLGAILVFLVCCHLYRWASSFIVLGYVKIINNLNFDFNYASFLLFLPVGFSFPSPITPGCMVAWHHLQVICSSVTWLRLLFQLSWLVALYLPTSLYFYSACIASPAASLLTSLTYFYSACKRFLTL